jgi:Rod binding domain-containing protein
VSTLSPITAAQIPAEVRKEGGTNAYKAALGFESMLLDQLSQTLVKDSGLGDSPYASSVTEAFSTSLLQGGGVGLADQLYKALKTDVVRSGELATSGGRNAS